MSSVGREMADCGGSLDRVGRESHSRLRMAMCSYTTWDVSGCVATPTVDLTRRYRRLLILILVNVKKVLSVVISY